jgi:hypothetical protein
MPLLDIKGYQNVITLNNCFSHIYWLFHQLEKLHVINSITADDIFHNYFKKLHMSELGDLAYSRWAKYPPILNAFL